MPSRRSAPDARTSPIQCAAAVSLRKNSNSPANDEISAQDYNLSVSTYVEQEDTREVIDIVQLNAEIEQIVAREQVLREEISKIVAEIEGV